MQWHCESVCNLRLQISCERRLKIFDAPWSRSVTRLNQRRPYRCGCSNRFNFLRLQRVPRLKNEKVSFRNRWLILAPDREIILYCLRATGCGIATLVYKRHLSPGVCTSCSHLHAALLCIPAQASDVVIPPLVLCTSKSHLCTHVPSLWVGLRGRSYE